MSSQNMQDQVYALVKRQRQDWPLANQNFKHLQHIEHRELPLQGATASLQYNPERMRSAAAKVDAKSLEARPCFLCATNRPELQESILFQDRYEILVNPFPIFPNHLTIASTSHTPQKIENRLGDMLQLSKALPHFVIFYNGAKCGASAPDHMHFQAADKGCIPLEKILSAPSSRKEMLHPILEKSVYQLKNSSLKALVCHSDSAEQIILDFHRIHQYAQSLQIEEHEPMLNILTWYDEQEEAYTCCIILRKTHRPWQFHAEGADKILISPASVEMGGLFVLAREEDFQKLQRVDIEDILHQTLMDQEDLNSIIDQM